MKKKLNAALLMVVLGVWGTVVYRYVSQYLSKPVALAYSGHEMSLKAPVPEKDSFELRPLVRDPFLNNASAPVVLPVYKKNVTVVKKEKKQPHPSEFPAVDYLGYIKSANKNDELALLKVNGKLIQIRINQTASGVRALQLYKDSIKITFQGEVRFIRKHQIRKSSAENGSD